MKLKVMLPSEVLVEAETSSVTAEAENGSFCLEPRHIGFVASLATGILSFVTAEGKEEFIAVDGGILVKCESEVLVSTNQAVRGTDLGTLKETVEEQFGIIDEREQASRSAVNKLEVNLVRKFIDFGKGNV